MRLIDADALKFNFQYGYDDNGTLLVPYRDAKKLIEAAKTVYAVPVVRCRDCKHHYWEQEPCHGKSVHYCKLPHMRGVEVFKEFFCYYGERKEV